MTITMNKEIWHPVLNFPNYEVSNFGQIKTIRNGKIRQPSKGRYLLVSLSRGGLVYGRYIHRLVAEVFIANPDNKPQVNHINGERGDNRAENLEWVTGSENMKHAYCAGLQTSPLKGRLGKDNHFSKKVIQLKNGEVIQIFGGLREASRITGIKHQTISRVCRGIGITAGGYNWKYKTY